MEDFVRNTSIIRNGIGFTTQHIARPNNENDLEILLIVAALIPVSFSIS